MLKIHCAISSDMLIDNLNEKCRIVPMTNQGGINMSAKNFDEKCTVISTWVEIEGNMYLTYGIEYKHRRIEDLSVDRPAVENLAYRMEVCDVDASHIDYVVEDFLVRCPA